ncbi:MAG: TolC family protein [candidate division WOR-3 bacterium]
MLRIKIPFLLLLNFGLFSLTFKEAKEIALSKNRELTISELEVKKAELVMRESWASFYPTVNFQSSYTRLLSVPQFEMETPFGKQYISLGYPDNFKNSLQITFPVFTFGKRLIAKEIGERSKEIQDFQYQADKISLLKDLVTVYYGVVVAKEGVKIAEEALERAKAHLNTARIQYSVGRITKLDLLSAETEYNKQKTELLNAKNGLTQAHSALNIMLGFPLDSVVEIEDKMEVEIDSFNLDSLTILALNKRPEIQSIKKLTELSNLSQSLQYLSFLPNVIFSGNFSYDKPHGFINEWDNDITATIAITLPIFEGFSRTNNIKKYRLSVEQAKIKKELVEEGIKMEIKNLFLTYRLHKENLKLAEEQLKRAKEAYQMAETQYKIGYISTLEYKDIELGYRSAEFARLNALYNLIVSKEQVKIATMMN